MVFGEVDEVLRARVGVGQALEVRQHVLDARDVGAAVEVGKAFAIAPLRLIQIDEPVDRFGGAARGNLGGDPAE